MQGSDASAPPNYREVEVSFVDFMRGTGGRLFRIVAGPALIVVGLAVVGGAGGVVMTVVGLVPIAARLFNFCLLGPVRREPLGRPPAGRVTSCLT
ncbi:MAG: DUF2892 domain-containing protein [Solirubrobacterales bacterium]